MDPGSASKGQSPSVKFRLSRVSRSPAATASMNRHSTASSRRSSRHNAASTSILQTPNGPVLTPKGDRSQSMVLLSPSRTIGESLTTLASSTAQQLEGVWDEVGYNPEERASQLSDLLIKFRDLCDEKISEERGVAQTFRQEIANAKEEYQQTAQALKMIVDPQLLRDENAQTLTEQLATFEAALEGLRESAAIARDDLEKCRSFLIEAHAALGLDMDPKWKDVESDLTFEKRELFHTKVAEMKDEVNSRTSAVIVLIKKCKKLMNDLGYDYQSGSELDRQIAGSLVVSKDDTHMLASKFKTETCTGIGANILEELSSKEAELTSEKERREAKLRVMGNEICLLWEKLRVPIEDQTAFEESIQGLTLETIEKGEAELARVRALKGQMMNQLLDECRERIAQLWEETNSTPEQRSAFAPYFVNDSALFDDDLLEQHEEYTESLEARLEQMKPILRMIERREEILEERMEYEELQKDSDRLKQRGAALTKQLMKEEKMAKRIKRELPKLTAMLHSKLLTWKEEHGEQFLVHGKGYLEIMNQQDADWTQYKENEAQAKLKKKQMERAEVECRFGQSGYKALPGKKGKSQRTLRPMGDAKNKENVASAKIR